MTEPPAPDLFAGAGKSAKNNFKVVVRVRPVIEREADCLRCMSTPSDSAIDVVKTADVRDAGRAGSAAAGGPAQTFAYDRVFAETSRQVEIYDVAVAPVVLSVLEGYNGSIIAYGQTGTGKTHTIEGDLEGDERGIIPRCAAAVFSYIQSDTADAESQWLVRVTYLQIYNERISDLLEERDNLRTRESGEGHVYVEDLSEHVVRNPRDVFLLLQQGKTQRATNSTKFNKASSRSHAVFTLIIEHSQRPELGGNPDVTVGRLHLVDLAGSERFEATEIEKHQKETQNINLSLTAFGKVVLALTSRGVSHVPYRDSKLTRILQDSLGGNCKTTLITTVSPMSSSFLESLATLKFANRAKNVKNTAVVNKDTSGESALLSAYQAEIKQLRELLRLQQHGGQSEGVTPCVPLVVAGDAELVAREREIAAAQAEKKTFMRRIAELEQTLVHGGAQVEDTDEFKAAMRRESERLQSEHASRAAIMEAERARLEKEKEAFEAERKKFALKTAALAATAAGRFATRLPAAGVVGATSSTALIDTTASATVSMALSAPPVVSLPLAARLLQRHDRRASSSSMATNNAATSPPDDRSRLQPAPPAERRHSEDGTAPAPPMLRRSSSHSAVVAGSPLSPLSPRLDGDCASDSDDAVATALNSPRVVVQGALQPQPPQVSRRARPKAAGTNSAPPNAVVIASPPLQMGSPRMTLQPSFGRADSAQAGDGSPELWRGGERRANDGFASVRPASATRSSSARQSAPDLTGSALAVDVAAASAGAGAEIEALRQYTAALQDPRNGIALRNRRLRLTLYRDCFSGTEGAAWFMTNMEGTDTVEAARAVGQSLLDLGVIAHVRGGLVFSVADTELFQFRGPVTTAAPTAVFDGGDRSAVRWQRPGSGVSMMSRVSSRSSASGLSFGSAHSGDSLEGDEATDNWLDGLDSFFRAGATGAEDGAPLDALLLPLHAAAANGDLGAVRAWLQMHVGDLAALDAPDMHGRTPLMYAVILNHGKVCRVLLKAGANVNASDAAGTSCLAWGACRGCHDAVKLLLRAGAAIDHTDDALRSALHWATKLKRVDVLLTLLRPAFRSLVNRRDNEGLTALHWAVMCGHDRHAEALVASGADASTGDNEGRTAVHYAASSSVHGAVACVATLVRLVPTIVNMRDQAGRTALHLACAEGNVGVVTALLACPAIDVGAEDQRLTTSLHWAVVCNKPELCRLLLEAGAKVTARDANDMTPLQYATEKRFHECVNVLQRYWASAAATSRLATSRVLSPTSGAPLLQPSQLLAAQNGLAPSVSRVPPRRSLFGRLLNGAGPQAALVPRVSL